VVGQDPSERRRQVPTRPTAAVHVNADFHTGGSAQLSGELVADGAPTPGDAAADGLSFTEDG